MKRFLLILALVGTIGTIVADEYDDLLNQYNLIYNQMGQALAKTDVDQLDRLINAIHELRANIGKAPQQIQNRLRNGGISLEKLNEFAEKTQNRRDRLGGSVLTVRIMQTERQLAESKKRLTELQNRFDQQLGALAGGDRENAGQMVLERYRNNPEDRARITQQVVAINATVESSAAEVLEQDRAGHKNELGIIQASEQIGAAKAMNKALIDGKDEEIGELEQRKSQLESHLQEAKNEINLLEEEVDRHQSEVQRYENRIRTLDEQLSRGKALSEAQQQEYKAAVDQKALEQRAADIAINQISAKQEQINKIAQEKQQLEFEINRLKDEIEQIKEQNEKLNKLLAQLSEAYRKIESVASAFRKLIELEAQLDVVTAEYNRLNAIKKISEASPDVRERVINNIEGSSLSQAEKKRLLAELEKALYFDQYEELDEQQNILRTIRNDIKDVQAIIKTLGKRAQSRIQEVVAPYQTMTQQWLSGNYPKEQMSERDKQAIILAERALEQEKALAAVSYNAMQALAKSPQIFGEIMRGQGSMPGGISMAPGLGGPQAQPMLMGPESEAIAAAGQLPAVVGEAPSRLDRLRGWWSFISKHLGSSTETDLAKIVEQAESEIESEQRNLADELMMYAITSNKAD
ncbi:hypothetical protein A3F06_01405 [candidate division TM6 bacterium RIFCSPHIGHO2_12_FULL_36_22]|nr:MAG: hypothetical protein A3F06_01405 [candidate division TM6 bacterium RIFCSPHIGHO2_12_FULL_36_22]